MDTSTDALVGFDEGYRVGIYEFAKQLRMGHHG